MRAYPHFYITTASFISWWIDLLVEAKKQSTDRLIEAKNKSPSFNSGFTGKGRKEQRNDKDWGEQRERRKVVSAEYYIVHRQPTLSKWRARYGFCARSFVDFCVAQFCGFLRRAVLWISAPHFCWKLSAQHPDTLHSVVVSQCIGVGGFLPAHSKGCSPPPPPQLFQQNTTQCTHCILITATLQSAHSRVGLLPSPLLFTTKLFTPHPAWPLNTVQRLLIAAAVNVL